MDLLGTFTDFCDRPRPYLDRVGRGERFRLRGYGRDVVMLTKVGLASERPVALVIGSGALEEQQRRVRAALAVGVVQVTRWGVVDGVLEVVT